MASTEWDRVRTLYAHYGDTIAPLIARVEVQYGVFPVAVLNELRAFTTHVARIANDDFAEGDVAEQLARAERHIVRIKLDLYKYLALWYRDEYLERFPLKFSNVDLDTIIIDDEKMMTPYYRMLRQGVRLTEEAKGLEVRGPAEKSMNVYYDALEQFTELDKMVIKQIPHIIEAKRRTDRKEVRKKWEGFGLGVLASLVAAVIWYFCVGS